MFVYDKDMERVMQAKKREILAELEKTKCRLLKELSGVDKVTLTRLREIIADYNRIDFNLNERLNAHEERFNKFIQDGEVFIVDGENVIAQFQNEIARLDEIITDIHTLEHNLENLSETVNEIDTRVTWVTPQMFGAVGDGVTDDTEAFAQLSGKYVFIPEGTYILKRVVFGSGTHLVGVGTNKTILKQHIDDVANDFIVLENANDTLVSNLSIYGNWEEFGGTSALSSNTYKGLLKVRTTANNTDSSNRLIIEHVQVFGSSGSGVVLLGNGTDPLDNTTTQYNWVYVLNDVVIKDCVKYCMIDETCDNKYNNLMFSNGGLADLYCNCSSNIYSNVKLDGVGGKSGNVNDNESGALLVINQCGNLQFANLDVQSAGIDGIKIFTSWGLDIQGSVNNVGISNEEQGTCLKILGASQSSKFDLSFYSSGYETMREIFIDEDVRTCVVFKRMEYNTKESDVYNPKYCTVIYPSTWRNIGYDFSVPVAKRFENLLQDQMCEDLTKWSIDDGITENGSIYDGKSFHIVGNGDYQSLKSTGNISVKNGDVYLAMCVASAESLGAERLPFPYISTTGGERLRTQIKTSEIEIGQKYLCAEFVKATGETLRFQMMNAQNTSVTNVSNMVLINLTELLPYVEESYAFYDNIENYLATLIESKIESVGATYTDPQYLPLILSKACSDI